MSRKEYPHKLDHVLLGDEDALPPRALHPIFFGSFDWHSCVHGWWTLLTLRRLFPDMPEAQRHRRARRRQLHAREGRRRARLSRPAAEPRVRAALWLGVAAVSAPRSDAPRRRLGRRARAARARLRRSAFGDYLRDADLSDPRRHPLQHRLRAGPFARMGGAVRPRAGRPHPRPRAALVRGRPRLPGVGAGRRRVPVAGADRGACAWRARTRR